MRVIVHGGAGSVPAEPTPRQQVLETAASAASDADDPTGAVCTAARILEADPRFNAGTGGAVQSDGRVRTDAGLMTDDREVGAACAMPSVEHAVDVARVVNSETPHVLLAGVHAVDLAAEHGIETGVDLLTERTRQRWAEADPPASTDVGAHLAWVRERFGDDADAAADGARETRGRDHDTVGAVATDGERLAAATSTAGRWFALAGRVGDVPQVGSGFYCSPAGGASATGAGEDIARVTLARRAVDRLESGDGAQAAAEAALEEFGDLVDGDAGVIVLTPDGDAGRAFDAEVMQTCVADDSEHGLRQPEDRSAEDANDRP
jgi:isoaspartyl peptidase/L-asparaginase-like protein (Ntn-hydrolase superfamily)